MKKFAIIIFVFLLSACTLLSDNKEYETIKMSDYSGEIQQAYVYKILPSQIHLYMFNKNIPENEFNYESESTKFVKRDLTNEEWRQLTRLLNEVNFMHLSENITADYVTDFNTVYIEAQDMKGNIHKSGGYAATLGKSQKSQKFKKIYNYIKSLITT